MSKTYLSIVKHSGVYAVGQILSRCASILLLPVYTRHLNPADYGCIAVLDLTATLLGVLIGSGLASALGRYHFEAHNDADQDRTWWTGLTIVGLAATAFVTPAFLLRSSLEAPLLGPGAQAGGYLALVLPTVWFTVLIQVLETHLRVQKLSICLVGLSLGRLVLNIALNLYFLITLRMGVWGILAGNLAGSAALAVALSAIFVAQRGAYRFDRALASQLLTFGGPILVMMLMGMVMHQSDRYILRLFVDLDVVGVYALAYSIGQAVNTLYQMPFSSIWNVAIYEIARQPDAKVLYARAFEFYVYGLMLISLGVSLFARPLLTLVAPDDYAAAAGLVPVVCLAYVFYSVHEHFKVPALLAKRTVHLLPAGITGALANIALNFALIPVMGAAGAAWVSVVTFAIYSGIGLWRYRKIDRYEYPFARCGLVLLGMIGTYGLLDAIRGENASSFPALALPALAWTAWAAALFGPVALSWLMGRSVQAALTGAVPSCVERS